MEGPLIVTERPETVLGQTDAFTDADASGTYQQQCMGVQVVHAPEFLL
jgi:hypothetical protein